MPNKAKWMNMVQIVPDRYKWITNITNKQYSNGNACWTCHFHFIYQLHLGGGRLLTFSFCLSLCSKQIPITCIFCLWFALILIWCDTFYHLKQFWLPFLTQSIKYFVPFFIASNNRLYWKKTSINWDLIIICWCYCLIIITVIRYHWFVEKEKLAANIKIRKSKIDLPNKKLD